MVNWSSTSLLAGALALLSTLDCVSAASKNSIRPNPPNGHWVDAWASMPQLVEPANLPPAPFNASGAVFVNTTLRQTIYSTTTSSQLRLTISNAFGTTPLPITAVTIALAANNTAGISAIQASTLKPVTFSSSASISIPAGALALSDVISLSIKPGSIITISIYLSTGQLGNSITGHPGSRTTSYLVVGDHTESAGLSDATKTDHWYLISALSAWVPPQTRTLSILGDSLTDGRGSTTNANNRWPDQLLARLQKTASTRDISIANQAAGGNRILADGLGPSLLSRVERDVLAHPGIGYVIVFEGVNDIGTAAPDPAVQESTYQALIQAYAQITARLHTHGIPVFGATITPFSAPANVTIQPYSHPEREKTRQRVNKWIRESGTFDEVFDFDRLVRSTQDPAMLDKRWDSGDYLHMSVEGYGRLAGGVEVGVLERWRGGADEFV